MTMNEIRPSIYVAEDDAACRDLYEAILSFSYDVRSFPNGLLALEAIREDQSRPNLLITDYNMPVMNGEELIREARKFWLTVNPDRIVPIIILTGAEVGYDPAGRGFRDRMLSLGVADLLIKPMFPAVLLAAVSTHLG